MSYQIILAPLQGYTDAVFRDVYFRHFTGVDEAMAPFISTMSQQKINLSCLKDVVPENNLHCPRLIPQILGNVAEDFLFLARHLVELGYDTVNLNMGCPHSKVAKKKRGSGMLPYPEMVDQLLDSVFKGLHYNNLFKDKNLGISRCKLSIKVRLGRYDKEEIFEILPIFEKYPLEEIIVHPRTGVEMYGGNADVDAFIRVADNTSHRLVYNGDITTLRSFDEIVNQLSVMNRQINRFMIGRGVLSNPFLPSAIKGQKRNMVEELDKIKLFHDELFAIYSHKFYGPLHVTGRMKGFWTYMGPSFSAHRKEIKKILKAKNREHYSAVAESFFGTMPVFNPDNDNFTQFEI